VVNKELHNKPSIYLHIFKFTTYPYNYLQPTNLPITKKIVKLNYNKKIWVKTLNKFFWKKLLHKKLMLIGFKMQDVTIILNWMPYCVF
jgi:hypothetical protein